MTLSLLKRREANLVLTCLRSNIREKKNIRRLQTLSISHCLLRRLRKCFDCFKLLLDPTFRMSAQEWYRKHLVSSVFGRWVKFVHDQQRDEGKLLDRSISFYKRKSIKAFVVRSRKRQTSCQRDYRGIHLALTYYSYLRLLESFEIICARKDANVLSRTNSDHARTYSNNRVKLACIVLLVHKAHIAQERHQRFEISMTHCKMRSLRICLSLWRNYKVMHRRGILINKSISPIRSHLAGNPKHHSLCPPCIQERFSEINEASAIWRVKMSRRALIALRNFTAKKKRFSEQGLYSRVREESELRDLTAIDCRNNRSVADQEKLVAQLAVMKIVMRKWTAGIVERSHWETALSVGASHWFSFGRYLQIIRAITAIQTRQKRSFVENRRKSLASLSHNQRLLRNGLKRFLSFARATRLESSCRMSADFKREIRLFTAGLSSLERCASQRSAAREGLLKAVVIWKVTRLVSAVRKWSRWVISKREKRVMLLEARSCYQQGLKETACRLWLTVAAGNIQKDRAEGIKMLVVRAAKKWRSLVYRNRLTRLKQEHMVTLTSYSPTHSTQPKMHQTPPSSIVPFPASSQSLLRAQPRALNPSFSPENLARTPVHRTCGLFVQSTSSANIMKEKSTAWPTRLFSSQSTSVGTSCVQSTSSSPSSHTILPISRTCVEAASRYSSRSGSGSGSGTGSGMEAGIWCSEARGVASSTCKERASSSERGEVTVTATPGHGLGLSHAPPRRQSSAPAGARTPGQGVCTPKGEPQTSYGGGNREGLAETVVHIDNRELLAREIIEFIEEMRAATDSQQ